MKYTVNQIFKIISDFETSLKKEQFLQSKILQKAIEGLPNNYINHKSKSTRSSILHKLIALTSNKSIIKEINELIIFLIKKGADINILNKNWETSIDLIFINSNIELIDWLSNNNYLKIDNSYIFKTRFNLNLLNHFINNYGLDVNFLDDKNKNLLHYAILYGQIDFAYDLVYNKKIEIESILTYTSQSNFVNFLNAENYNIYKTVICCEKTDFFIHLVEVLEKNNIHVISDFLNHKNFTYLPIEIKNFILSKNYKNLTYLQTIDCCCNDVIKAKTLEYKDKELKKFFDIKVIRIEDWYKHPLFIACLNQNEEIVNFLVEIGIKTAGILNKLKECNYKNSKILEILETIEKQNLNLDKKNAKIILVENYSLLFDTGCILYCNPDDPECGRVFGNPNFGENSFDTSSTNFISCNETSIILTDNKGNQHNFTIFDEYDYCNEFTIGINDTRSGSKWSWWSGGENERSITYKEF